MTEYTLPVELRSRNSSDIQNLVDKKKTWEQIHCVDREDILHDMVMDKDILLLKFLFPAHVKSTEEGFWGKDLMTHILESNWPEAEAVILIDVPHPDVKAAIQ